MGNLKRLLWIVLITTVGILTATANSPEKDSEDEIIIVPFYPPRPALSREILPLPENCMDYTLQEIDSLGKPVIRSENEDASYYTLSFLFDPLSYLYYDDPDPYAFDPYRERFDGWLFHGQVQSIDVEPHQVFYVKEGEWTTYFHDTESGEKRKTKLVCFENDTLKGTYKVWNLRGELLYETVADPAGNWYMKDYYPSGVLRAEGEYSNKKRDGVWTWYDPEGYLEYRELYSEGRRLKQLAPQDVQVRLLDHDGNIGEGFVILEREKDSSYYSYKVSWSHEGYFWLSIPDPEMSNLYVCRFGNAPERITPSELVRTERGWLAEVSLVKDTVDYGTVTWQGGSSWKSTLSMNPATRTNNYSDLPDHLLAEYHSGMKVFLNLNGGYNLYPIIPFAHLASLLKPGQNTELIFQVTKGTLEEVSFRFPNKVSGKSRKQITSIAERIKGLRMPSKVNDHVGRIIVVNGLDSK